MAEKLPVIIDNRSENKLLQSVQRLLPNLQRYGYWNRGVFVCNFRGYGIWDLGLKIGDLWDSHEKDRQKVPDTILPLVPQAATCEGDRSGK